MLANEMNERRKSVHGDGYTIFEAFTATSNHFSESMDFPLDPNVERMRNLQISIFIAWLFVWERKTKRTGEMNKKRVNEKKTNNPCEK